MRFSRCPARLFSPFATAPTTVELIVRYRDELISAGLDAGAQTIGWHLEHHHQLVVSQPTIHRILVRNDRIEPAPKKRPRSSYIRFEAEQPNECWQSDFTHYPLADGTDTEILSMTIPATHYGSPRIGPSPRRSSSPSSAPRAPNTENPTQH